MSFVKGTSLGVTVAAAIVMTAALAIVVGWRPGDPWAPLVVVGFGGGLTVGVIHWFLVGAMDGEMRRLADHTEAILAGRATTESLALHCGVYELAKAFEHASANLQQQLAEAGSLKRELEVRARLAEAELTHLEAVLDTMSDAVIVTDTFNEVALANRSAAQVFDFQLPDCLHQPIDQVLSQPQLARLIKDARAGGNTALRKHAEHRRAHGGDETVYDVTLACIARPDLGTRTPSSGEGGGVVTILRDVTKEKLIADSKSDFVSNVSHELRTPITSIKAYLEMLIDGEAEDPTTRDEFYNIIQGETNRLSRLIDNILNISRIESGIIKVQRELIALPTLIKEALDILQPQARAKHIDLVDRPSPLYFQVFADRDMILQCLLNLIGNAIKYTPDGGTVTVDLAVDDHARTVCVSVTDTGVGIPEEAIEQLFDKFYRVADHKNMAKGTGLGLSLVKHVIEHVHAGTVGVSSEKGRGSAFTFTLPIAED